MRECEEMLKIVQGYRDSRLGLAGDSRLASCQLQHTSEACRKINSHDSWSTTGQKFQFGCSVSSRLELAT